MEFRMLGRLEVREHDQPIPLGGGRQRAVLALLLLNANRTVSTERVIDELWEGTPPPTAAKIVQNYISGLRSSFAAAGGEPDEVLTTRGSGYELRVRSGETDVDHFEDELAAGRRALAAGEASEAARTLRAALEVWRGPALADFALENFAQTDIARLEERRLVALEARFEADLALGHHSDLVGELEALIAQHPLRERLRGHLMVALYRSGRQAEALYAYQAARKILVSELGLEPGPALQRLEQDILRHDPSLDLPDSPAAGVRAPVAEVTPPVSPRLASGRRLLAVGAVLLLTAAAGALVLMVTRRDGAGLAAVAANSVGVIDPGSNRVVAQIPVGRTPTSIAVGEGAVWVLNADDQTLSRIDPETRDVEEFGTGTKPTDLAAGAGAVWVGNGVRPSALLLGHPVATSISKLDPAFGHVRETIELPRPAASVSNVIEDHIAVGADAVWAINPDYTVARIDPRSGAVTRVGSVQAVAIAAEGRSVWVLNVDGTVARLNPESGRVQRRIEISATTLTDIAIGDGSVWLAAPFDGVVWRVDPGRVRAVLRTIDAGFGVNRLAFGEGSLWTANSLNGTVGRIDVQSNRLVRTFSLGNTPRSVAVGEGRVWTTVAGAAVGNVAVTTATEISGVTALSRSICGNVFYGGAGAPDYLIVSDLPLQSGSAFAALQMSEAIAFTLRRRGFRAGSHRIAYQSCDDSTTATGIFDPAKCTANTKAYGANPDVLGVIGPLNSDCAAAAIPVANAAPGPLAIVSPANSVVGLTRPAPNAPRDELERLYPTGIRNYLRIFPTEDSQSAANAVLARQLRLRRIYVLHDGDVVFGLPKATYFRRAASRVGLDIVGFKAWDPQATGYAETVAAVVRARPNGVFLGGGLYSNGGTLLRDLRARLGPSIPIFAPEFLPISALFEAAGASARGTYVSLFGVTNDRLPPAGRRFVREFAQIQPGGTVNILAVYAAQATEVLLDAIARSDGTRASVLTELRSLRVRDGILGDFRFTASGDTTQQPITILRAEEGGGAKEILGYEGGVVDRVIRPSPDLTR